MPKTETREITYVSTDQPLIPIPDSASESVASAVETIKRERYFAVADDLDGEFHAPHKLRLRVPDTEADRFIEATRTLVERVREISRQDDIDRARLNPNRLRTWRRVLWMVRNAGGPDRMREAYREEYEAVRARQYGEVALAYQAYDEQTADLAEYVRAELARKKQKAQRDKERRAARERRKREERAAALGGPEDAIWTCRLREDSEGQWAIDVWLPALDPDPTPRKRRLLKDVTAGEVQAEITRQRAEHPYTSVVWSPNTRRAMRERNGSRAGKEIITWEELTGERIKPRPPRPRKNRSSGPTHGPSSTYGSDYGAGGSGGDFGGGDYGGAGYGGGFGGSY
ncbi:hypothetical protein [Actinomadura sp. GC306]|uniref:hypothetical protein n=1 Tax=Actinomadura sp. GC306 TaxID=2530367 RepID=UPI001404C847|nr:hypothetical protein [Actinomadura sp. GC306]